MNLVRASLLVLVGLGLGLSISAGRAAPADPKEQLARELMEATGASKMGEQVMSAVGKQMESLPGVPAGTMDRLLAEASGDELVERVLPIYVKHYDEKTLKAAVKFFNSREGRAFIEAQPAVLQESMAVGQAWGQELAQRMLAPQD